MGIFLSSKLPKQTLAHVWFDDIEMLMFIAGLFFARNLADVNHNGKLNSEQFALAMHLISKKVRVQLLLLSSWEISWRNVLQVKGVELPGTLTPEMIPPSCRHADGLTQRICKTKHAT